MVSSRHRSDGDTERFGLDETENKTRAFLGKFVPAWAARKAVSVSVSTDKREYRVDEPVEIGIEFYNRLPVPITISTPQRQLWSWTVDGLERASDERTYVADAHNSLSFRGRERKQVTRSWDGRFKRTRDGGTRWERAEPREYEITAYLATEGDEQPTGSTTIQVVR